MLDLLNLQLSLFENANSSLAGCVSSLVNMARTKGKAFREAVNPQNSKR